MHVYIYIYYNIIYIYVSLNVVTMPKPAMVRHPSRSMSQSNTMSGTAAPLDKLETWNCPGKLIDKWSVYAVLRNSSGTSLFLKTWSYQCYIHTVLAIQKNMNQMESACEQKIEPQRLDQHLLVFQPLLTPARPRQSSASSPSHIVSRENYV